MSTDAPSSTESNSSGTIAPNLLKDAIEAEGIARFALTPLTTPLTISFYETWLESGFHGEMHYLARHLPEKREPNRLLPQARSAIVMAIDYLPHPEPVAPEVAGSLRLANYARGRDYHHFLKGRLARVIARLSQLAPDESFLACVDSEPVLERDLARRAGLGWVGKNTCLISRTHGSFFFIAEIYTTLAATSVAHFPVPDHCGTCTRCLDACPTGALVAPRTLDARKCISYLTIEARSTPPVELRGAIGDWFFGCDICQTVCPWNIKVDRQERLTRVETESTPVDANANRAQVIEDLRSILTSSNRNLRRRFRSTALARVDGWGLKRNAIVVATNQNLFELRDSITEFLKHPRLEELAGWAIKTLTLKATGKVQPLPRQGD